MTHIAGFVVAVPQADREAYRAYAAKAWEIFRRHGALRAVEAWGVDVPQGKRTDFYRAVDAQPGEAVLFSWIEWPDRATCDAAWAAMETDPEMEAMGPMPFDGSRMILGGFEPILDERA